MLTIDVGNICKTNNKKRYKIWADLSIYNSNGLVFYSKATHSYHEKSFSQKNKESWNEFSKAFRLEKKNIVIFKPKKCRAFIFKCSKTAFLWENVQLIKAKCLWTISKRSYKKAPTPWILKKHQKYQIIKLSEFKSDLYQGVITRLAF